MTSLKSLYTLSPPNVVITYSDTKQEPAIVQNLLNSCDSGDLDESMSDIVDLMDAVNLANLVTCVNLVDMDGSGESGGSDRPD